MNTISYKNLADSQIFYEKHGFATIDAPWYVTEEIKNITSPQTTIDYKLSANNKFLVASGEQSFLYLAIKGQLPTGYYQSITPCFRFEEINFLHRKTFMKNELIYITDDPNQADLHEKLSEIIEVARKFFMEKLKSDKIDTELCNHGNSVINYDLMYKGKELGSYGIRSYHNINWVYATGCAEPRLSTLQKL